VLVSWELLRADRSSLSQAFAFSYCCIVLYGSFNASIGHDLSTITPEEFTNYQKVSGALSQE
jgi:hypothetical protein